MHLLLFQNTQIQITMPYIALIYPALFIAHTVRNCYRTQIRSIKTFNNQPNNRYGKTGQSWNFK